MATTKNGTTRADKLTATANSTTLNGLAGDDTLSSGNFSSVTLSGGDGNDTFVAKVGDVIIGGNGVDTVQFAAGIGAGALGQDDLVAVENVVITNSNGAGYDFSAQTEKLNISGGKGGDTITGGQGADTLSGGAGDDTLDVQATDALIDGGTGSDTAIFRTAISVADLTDKKLINVEQVVIANEVAATYDFSVQSEGLIISGTDAFDTVIGGKGIDTVQFAADVSGVYDSEFINSELSDLELKNVEVVKIVNDAGISLNLSLQTESLQIFGAAGDDTIWGGYRADTITGGEGEDYIRGNDGADFIFADESDWLIDGGAGDDTVSYAAGVSYLADDELINVERIVITNAGNAEYDFSAQGDAGLEQLNISGGKANDTIYGGQDADTLSGGAGNDLLIAQDSDALIDGGAGTDTVRFGAAVSALALLDKDLVAVERIEITTDDDDSYDFSVQTEGLTIIGGSYDDAIKGAGKAANTIDGGDGDDDLTGGTGNDNLVGGYGNDYLFGAAGNDNLSGGDGNDILVGATGTGTSIDADTLRGGDGADVLIAEDTDALIDGGSNASTGVYVEYDTVQFSKSVSAINLRDVDMVGVEKVVINNTQAGRYDFSVQSEALIIRGAAAADSIVGGKDWDWIWGGAGVDDLKGGLGADRFDFTSLSWDQDSTPGLVTDLIRDFSGQTLQGDTIVGRWGAGDSSNYVEAGAPAASLADLLTAADDALNGTVKYYVGEFNGDSYLVTDNDGNGYTEVIRLFGVKLAGIQATDIVWGEAPRIGDAPNTSNLIFDLGAGDRNGDSSVDQEDRHFWEGSSPDSYYAANDVDLYFDDIFSNPDGDAAFVKIGDRVRGLTEVDFSPGVTALNIPDTFGWKGDDNVDDAQFEVYYGTYVTQDGVKTFTVTSTPGTTGNPTTATHTMILYDNDTSGNVGFIEGLVFDGVYAENQWHVTDGYTPNATLSYDALAEGSYMGSENVIYGGGGAETFYGSDGIDIIYGGAGNDTLYGGIDDDSLVGGDGDDFLQGDSGNDTLTGWGGDDTFNVNWGTDTITDLGTGDVLILAADNVEAISTGVTHFVATSSTSTGGFDWAGRIEIQAAASDSLIDVSLATVANNTIGFTLTGNVGDDSLKGSANNDTITGGAGSDLFVFGATEALNGTDVITDFTAGDGLDFSGVRSVVDGAAGFNDDFGINDFESGAANQDVYISGTGVYALIDNMDGFLGGGDLVAAGSETSDGQISVANGTDAILIVGDLATDTELEVYRVYDSNGTGSITPALDHLGTVTLIGVLTLDSLVAANIA